MSTLFTYKKTKFGKFIHIVVVGFLFVVILGTSFGLDTPRAQAQVAVVKVADTAPTTIWQDIVELATKVSTGISASANSVSASVTSSLGVKAFTLDGIAWALAKQVLAQMQKETVRWINSGFQGNPAFVQDLGGFLQDNADRLAGEFIYGSDLKALCSPFQLNIRIALSLKYLKKDLPARCTLSKVVGNVDRFLAGSFADGGLPGWFEMTVNPNNNFFGASAAAESALLGKRGQKKEQDINKLIFGKGFLGKEECTLIKKVTTADEFQGQTTANVSSVCGSRAECEKLRPQVKTADEFGGETTVPGGEVNCKTVTPGDTIANGLNNALKIPQDTLINAHQINEVISALFQQLTVQVFTGARGLLGTTQSSGDGRPAYLDQINNPQYDTMPTQSTIGNDIIVKATTQESKYRALYAGVVSQADAILARIKELQTLSASRQWTCSDMSGVGAQVTAIRDPAFAKQTSSDKNLETLNDLQERFVIATKNAQYSATASQDRLDILQTFIALKSDGTLHTDVDTMQAKVEIEGESGVPVGVDLSSIAPTPLQTRLATLASQLETLCHATPAGGAASTIESGGE